MSATTLPNVSLAFWNLDVKEPPTIGTVRDHLRANTLDTDRAAEIPDTTAFRRAGATIQDKTTAVKYFTRKLDSAQVCQIDNVYEEDGRIKRAFRSQYTLTDGTVKHYAGETLPDFETAFEQAKTHYVGADISKVIQAILTTDGLGAYTPRKNGGVYFVPVQPSAADLLQRIENFAAALSVRFLTYSIPDTAAQREEIADAVSSHYFEEIGLHAEAIASYTEDTRPGIIDNRRAAIMQTDTSIQKLRPIMNGRFETCRESMRELLQKLRELDARTEERQTANAAPVNARRQIVNV